MSPAYQKYVCIICGLIYDEAKGDPDSGLAPGTLFADIPDDWECPDCGVTKQDFVLLAEPETNSSSTPSSSISAASSSLKQVSEDAIVVLGGGIAAWEVIAQLRQQHTEEPIIMITHCSGDVYSKPQLSTALNKQSLPDQLIQKPALVQAATHHVTLIPYTRVLSIDPDKKKLILPTGGLHYRKLVLGLGARQKHIPFPGCDADRIYRINHLEQYRDFRSALDQSEQAHVAILGSGLIGCEFADDLLSAGHKVSLIDLAKTPLSHLLPNEISEKLAQRFQHKGVDILSGTTISKVCKVDEKLQLLLDNGKQITVDFLISAVGLQPNIELGKRAGLETQRGICVNERMQTSNPDIYALGDCAEHIDAKGNKRLLPYIKPILEQAKVIAAQIADDDVRYVANSDVVVIKTPSLPLSVCPPPIVDDIGQWRLVEEQGDSIAMAYYRQGKMTGFALSGSFTQVANQWFDDMKIAS